MWGDCTQARIACDARVRARERTTSPQPTVVVFPWERADWLGHYSTTVLPNGTHFWYKADDGM